MEVLRGLPEYHPHSRASAVAIGNFDGLHRGHRLILRRLLREAAGRGLSPVVLTFFPHPERALHKKKVLMIQTLDQRLSGLGELGVRTALAVSLGRDMALLRPAEFVRRILRERLGARVVVVGPNFRFGKGRQGTAADLKRLAESEGIRAIVVPPVKVKGKAVSSSLVRNALLKGRLEEARAYLGRPYELEGVVVKGKGRGRFLGFPTANLRTGNEILPAGVYLGSVELGAKTIPALTNIGRRPTFGSGPVAVEAHLIGFRKNLVGLRLKIRLLKKLRDERKFRSPQALNAQLRLDLDRARSFHGLSGKPALRSLTF